MRRSLAERKLLEAHKSKTLLVLFNVFEMCGFPKCFINNFHFTGIFFICKCLKRHGNVNFAVRSA